MNINASKTEFDTLSQIAHQHIQQRAKKYPYGAARELVAKLAGEPSANHLLAKISGDPEPQNTSDKSLTIYTFNYVLHEESTVYTLSSRDERELERKVYQMFSQNPEIDFSSLVEKLEVQMQHEVENDTSCAEEYREVFAELEQGRVTESFMQMAYEHEFDLMCHTFSAHGWSKESV